MLVVDLEEARKVFESTWATLKLDEQLKLCEAKLEDDIGVLKCKYNILYCFLTEQRQVESLVIM
jgi:hypothetical protein